MTLAAVLRAIGLDGGLWLDEILTLIESVRRPVAQIVTTFPSNNQHTLYSVLAHASISAIRRRGVEPAAAGGALRRGDDPGALFPRARIRRADRGAPRLPAARGELPPCLVLAERARLYDARVPRRGEHRAAAARIAVGKDRVLRGVRHHGGARRVHASDDGIRRGRACRRVRAAARCAGLRPRSMATLEADRRWDSRWRPR